MKATLKLKKKIGAARTVAIEFGTCRSLRPGCAAGYALRLPPVAAVLPFGAKNESHDNEHRGQLETTLKFSRHATLRFPQAAATMTTRGTRLETKVLSHCVVELKNAVSTLEAREGRFRWRNLLSTRQFFAGLYKIVGLPLHRVVQLWTEVAAGRLSIRDCAGTSVAFSNNAESAQSMLRAYCKQLVKR